MRRPVERRDEVPLLSIIYDPMGNSPVVLELYGDWELTGETYIDFHLNSDARRAADAVDFARNALADVMFLEGSRYLNGSGSEKEDNPPF